MTTYTKPSVRDAWGQTAAAPDIQDPGNTYASKGWQIGVKPPRQYVNWVLNYSTAAARYFCQRGIPDWDAAETYASASITLGPDGVIYQSLVNNNSNQSPATSPSQWGSASTPTPIASDRTQKIANTSWVGANFLPVSATFNAINGQIQNAQVPVGAVTQWQGSLSISGGQVTSAVAKANYVYNTSGNYATFNWSSQSGQPTWLWGSNDGINYFVWNPANFSVNNSLLLNGWSATTAAAGSTVVVRDGNGYIYGTYLNQSSSNSENVSISQFMVTNGGDSFLRKAAIASVVSQLAANGLLTSGSMPGSAGTNGYQKFANGITIQWLTCYPGGGTISASFPIAFANACLSVVATSTGTPTQCNVTGFTRTYANVYNTGGYSYVFAIGY